MQKNETDLPLRVFLAVLQYGLLVGLTATTAVVGPLWMSVVMGVLWSLAIVSEATQV